MCWLFHKWGKWEAAKVNYVRHDNSTFERDVQIRACAVCGRKQIAQIF